MRIRTVVIWKLAAIVMIASAAVWGTAGGALAATAAHGAYGPPPVPASVPPGGYTTVVTTVTIGPAGGTIGPLTVDGTTVTITVPAGAFPVPVQITVTAPILSLITPAPGMIVVAGAGIQVLENGSPYPGTFLKPVTVTFRTPKITAGSTVDVWNGSSFVTDPSATTVAGAGSVSFDTDPDFMVQTPAGGKPAQVPGATTPVTGKPFLGEGILAAALVLAGAGGIAASRRRRARG